MFFVFSIVPSLADRWSSRRTATLGHRAAWSGRGGGGVPKIDRWQFFLLFFSKEEGKIWMFVEISWDFFLQISWDILEQLGTFLDILLFEC